jgi:3-oxoacyl-ACP reductase-like protein
MRAARSSTQADRALNYPKENEKRKHMSSKNGQKLADKVAVVTGGSRGIGAAIAKRLATDGASVAITNYRSSMEST